MKVRGSMVKLTYSERHKIESMMSINEHDLKRNRNLNIILMLGNGAKVNEVATKIGVGRKTIWKISRKFDIFGIEGVLEDAPRTGRQRRISFEEVTEILQFPLYNKPQSNTYWTGTELAHRLNIPQSTIYGILTQWDVRLDDIPSLQDTCIGESTDSTNIEGVFISPSVMIILSTCNGDIYQDHSGVVKFTQSDFGKKTELFSKQVCDSIIEHAEQVITNVIKKGRIGTEATDVTIFLRIFEKRLSNKRGSILVSNIQDSTVRIRAESFVTNHPNVRLQLSQNEPVEDLKGYLLHLTISRIDVALKLEDLEAKMKRWLIERTAKYGIFVWFAPEK